MSDDVFKFLLGEGPLEGVHFGDESPRAPGRYWWREALREAVTRLTAENAALTKERDELREALKGLTDEVQANLKHSGMTLVWIDKARAALAKIQP